MLAGLILAGGEGRRFGGPKAWARLPDGRSFLEACSASLVGAGASPVLATLPPESGDPVIVGVQPLVLPEAGLDMFASLKVGLTRLIQTEDWDCVALLPVDHPLVRSETVSQLANADVAAAIPSYRGKHGHPICINREVVVAIVCGDHPGPTLREVLGAVGAVDIDVDDPGTIANCNTPAALSEALKAANFEF